MSQNRSSAVMQQRKEPHDSLDFFPTPLWATRALCEYFGSVYASDVHPYGYGKVADFLLHGSEHIGARPSPDWIITNPPFRLGMDFVERATDMATKGVAMLVRTAFLEGVERYGRLYENHPPTIIAQFTERVAMFKGRVDRVGSSATAYCWIVWTWNTGRSEFRWIPPCRRQLEYDGDWA